ncbi:hypothetical protein TEA_006770 [Camellia sinensis var. sinensis]|uniref:Uncharacterized protein n=1 Tax=Camellia sinensis var. sinensis TaxID=542762 RepID=A0A4S4D5X6_CAMSN|nr:hypothetical protein TEA_006770 [Camellia sinensis var. sinensis]
MLRHGMRGKSMAWPAGQSCSRRATRLVASAIPLGNTEFHFAAHVIQFHVSRRALLRVGNTPRGGKNQRGGTNRSDAGLNLSGSWQQARSATYNTPSLLIRLFAAWGRPREEPFPVRPPAGTATRSHRGSSSSSPPTADGFGTGTPVPSPQTQSFSRSYGSILPTSLAYIVPSTRGCSPWRPDAVMSTTGRWRHSVLRIFKGHWGRTGHHATYGTLPAAGPYLRLSHFQGGQAVKQKR